MKNDQRNREGKGEERSGYTMLGEFAKKKIRETETQKMEEKGTLFK